MGIAAGAAIAGVATLGSALIGSDAASNAAQTQADAANQASQTQLQMYNRTRSDLSPFMSGGSAAFSQLASIFGFGGGGATGTVGAAGSGMPNASAALSQLTQFPGYQFGLDQGVQALDRSAASRGLVLSGAQLKDAQAYGNGYAQQAAWTPYVSELNSIAGLGENAAAGVGNAGIQTGQGVANSQLAAGQAAASGSAAQGNIWGSALSQIGNQASGLFSSYGPITGGTSGAFSSPLAGYAPPITNTIDTSGFTYQPFPG